MDHWYEYAVDWAKNKDRRDLTTTAPEVDSIMGVLMICECPPAVEVETLDRMMVVPGEDNPEADATAYGSCEEAAAAGEELVQGSSGSGNGFPTTMVPSVRDGD